MINLVCDSVLKKLQNVTIRNMAREPSSLCNHALPLEE
jgi:hypothetical protein